MDNSIAKPNNRNYKITAPGYLIYIKAFSYPDIIDLGNCHNGSGK